MQIGSEQSVVSWAAAHTAVAAAVAHAEELGVRINVAVVDSGGNLAAFLRMPGAPLLSIDIARDKALTATSYGRPTIEWEEALAGAPSLLRDGLSAKPGMALFGGGLPIRENDAVCGGIGVSGAT